jgi:hypothetical protein
MPFYTGQKSNKKKPKALASHWVYKFPRGMPVVGQRRHPLIFHNKMKQIYSKFGSYRATKADFFLSPSELYHYSKREEVRQLTDQVRKAVNTPQYTELKAQLPAVLTQIINPDGTKVAKPDSQLTNTLFLEIDTKGVNTGKLIDESTLSNIIGLFPGSIRNGQISTGGGLHLLFDCRYTKDTYETAVLTIAEQIEKQTGLICDSGAQKLVQLKYISYDATHFYNDNTKPLLTLEGSKKVVSKVNKAHTTFRPCSPIYTLDTLREFEEHILANHAHLPKVDYNKWFRWACQLVALFGDDAEELFNTLTPYVRDNPNPSNMANQWKHSRQYIQANDYTPEYLTFQLTNFFNHFQFKPEAKPTSAGRLKVKSHCTEQMQAVLTKLEKLESLCIVADTGTGKTTLAAEICRHYRTTKRWYCCIIVPTQLQAEQLAKSTGFAYWTAGDSDFDLQVGYESGILILTLSGYAQVMPEHQRFDFVVFDEAHHIVTHYSKHFKQPLIQSFLKKPAGKVLYLTGTPCLEWLQLKKIPVLELLPKVRKRYLTYFYTFKDLNEIIEQIAQPVDCVHIMCNSRGQMKLLEAVILAKFPGITSDNIAVLHSDVRDAKEGSPLYRHKLVFDAIVNESKIPGQIKFVLSTSIIEEGINIEGKLDSIHVIDDPSQFSNTRVKQASARYRDMNDLPVFVWLQRWRTEVKAEGSLEDATRFESTIQSRFDNRYSPEAGRINRTAKNYNTPPEFRELNLCYWGQRSFFQYGSQKQIMQDLFKDTRYIYQVPEEALTKDPETYVGLMEIKKLCKQIRVFQAYLLYRDWDMFFSTIVAKKKSKQVVKGVPFQKVKGNENYSFHFENAKEWVSLTALVPTVAQLTEWGICREDVQTLVMAFSVNQRLSNTVFQRQLPTVMFRDVHFQGKFLTRYTKQHWDRLTRQEKQIREWMQAGLVAIGQPYEVEKLLEFDKVEATDLNKNTYRGLVNDWFEVESERKKVKGKLVQKSVIAGFHSFSSIDKQIHISSCKAFEYLGKLIESQSVNSFDSRFWAAGI